MNKYFLMGIFFCSKMFESFCKKKKCLPPTKFFYCDWWILVGTGWYQRHARKATLQCFLHHQNKKLIFQINKAERSEIGWIESKTKFQIFRVMVISVTSFPQFSKNFCTIFLILFSTLRIFHESEIKTEGGDLLVAR